MDNHARLGSVHKLRHAETRGKVSVTKGWGKSESKKGRVARDGIYERPLTWCYIRGHSQLMSVGHFDFQDFYPPPNQRKCPQKCPLRNQYPLINVRKKCPQVFELEQLMSALFENLLYESQYTSSIRTQCSKWCLVMLRFPCLYNT